MAVYLLKLGMLSRYLPARSSPTQPVFSGVQVAPKLLLLCHLYSVQALAFLQGFTVSREKCPKFVVLNAMNFSKC